MAYKNIEDRRAYDRAYRKRYSEAQKKAIANNKQHIRERNRHFIREYLSTHPCTMCGYSNVAALQFHHIDPKEKKYEVSNMTSLSIESIEKEIAKCEVLCANCHAIKTSQVDGWYK